jgi:F0F1-type ATP synthase membrane subunit c/vacuolar-type H+-ATPase subunit K
MFGEGDGLVALRLVFLSFCNALVLFGVVLLLIDLDAGSSSISVATGSVITAVAGAALLLTRRLVRRPLRCTDEQSLAASYRVRFFLDIALGEVAALLGFVMSFLAADPIPYLLGAAITALAFAGTAPTRRHLAQDQEALNTSGCGLDLVSSLRDTLPRTS